MTTPKHEWFQAATKCPHCGEALNVEVSRPSVAYDRRCQPIQVAQLRTVKPDGSNPSDAVTVPLEGS